MTTSIKTCFKCGVEQPLSEYYVHAQMGDGHLNKCKTCTKKDVKAHRLSNLEAIRAYDRERGNRQSEEYLKEYRERFPEKYLAHYTVTNAVRDGKLVRKPCEECGEERSHAHHDDYSKPLDVRWLCAAHHRQWHVENGEADGHGNPSKETQ